MKIALSHFRVGETDGVSLEMDKWAIALESLGHSVIYIAGSKGETKRHTEIIEEMYYKSTKNAELKTAFYEDLKGYTEDSLKEEILDTANNVQKKLVEIIYKEEIDILVPNNIFSLGHDIPVAIGFYNAILETGVKVVCHHHDFWWESSRPHYQKQTTAWGKEVMEKYFPPTNASIDMLHCVINSLAKTDLKNKKNLESTIVPNVFDFKQKQFVEEDYNRDFKKQLGVSDNQILLLQATRVANRKAIELAVDLVNKLNRPEIKNQIIGKKDYKGNIIPENVEFVLALVGLHEGIDNYEAKLEDYIKHTDAKVIINQNLVEHSRKFENNIKKFSLWDAYVYADVITYPSIQEGWENQFLEAMFAKKPVALFEYDVYKSDIKPKGFLVSSFGDKYKLDENKLVHVDNNILDEICKNIVVYITNENERKNIVETNFNICEKYFSIESLKNILKPCFEINLNQYDFIEQKLKDIYKDDYKPEYSQKLQELICKYKKVKFKKNESLSQKNVYLITYGDSFYKSDEKTFKVFKKFADKYFKNIFTDIHFLPMFSYTSDDGFSVVDYNQIDPRLGDWEDLNELSKEFRLMYDFVANHISQKSHWFQNFLDENHDFDKYFIEYDKNFDTSIVVRPRTLPLFHDYKTKSSIKKMWTTFSEDQIDINYKNFDVFLEMTDIMISYVFKGASSIRLDAIGYIWKESATTCIHLKEAHDIIKVWRCIFDYICDGVQIITETNVPHADNIRYFGDIEKEANMVYQFALPPLVLHALTVHNSGKLSLWANTINKVSDTETFFNFLSSHDGIGLMPTQNILSDSDREILVNKVLENKGFVSYKNNTDGTKSVYELNINYFDALINKDEDINLELKVNKMIASHFILLSFVGVPAIYYNSILGSTNDVEAVLESGINRRINREKFDIDLLEKEMTENQRRKQIYEGIKNLIEIRKQEDAFSPYAEQQVVDFGKDFFAICRINKDEKIMCIVNLCAEAKQLNVLFNGYDIINKSHIHSNILFKPYGYVWVKIK